MRKIKRILILAIVTVIGVASFGCKPYQKPEKPVYGDFVCDVVTERNGVKLDTPYVSILELSEEGKSKKTIVVPSKISGYEVRIGRNGIWCNGGDWESDKLEKVYVCNGVKIVASDFLRFASVKRLFNMGTVGSEIVTSKDSGEEFTIYHLYIKEDLEKVNVVFRRNDNPEKYGRYWMDVLNNEKIAVIPPEPTRKGYKFDGWYKEEECITPWDFEHDIVPEPVYDEEGKCTNQIELFAKWVKE